MALDASRWRWIQAGVVIVIVFVFISLLLPAIDKARERAQRTQSRSNLKQLGLALHNYHEQYNCFPPGGTFDASGRGHHGWYLLLSPLIDVTPLYNSINTSEPWDTPRNATYFRFEPPIAINPSIRDVTPKHEFGRIHYSANSHLLAANSSVTLSEIKDKSNTFIIGELGGDFIPWACPYNWRPLTSLTATPRTYGRPDNTGGNFLMVDGSVRWIAPDIADEVYEALRGPDLAGSAGAEIKITRPQSFPVPPDALWTDEVYFREDFYGSALRDNAGNLLQLSLGRGRGGRLAHDADLLRFQAFPHLKTLWVSGDFSDSGLEIIARSKTLIELGVFSDEITDVGLLFLAELPKLTQLSVRGEQITPEGIARLQERLPACQIDFRQ
ncbi:MAG: DUF1559 domain-containing protein [Planctomycetes bacterium]|nr:DUF1559 domain-containing protein [Planctomycetota bacterium]